MENKEGGAPKTSTPTEGEQVIIEEKINKPNGEKSVRRYAKGKMLGKGGFAKCYEVTNLETKRILAAKIIPKNTLTKSRARQKLISEIKIHKSLNHQNVVKFEHVFEDHENVYILLELCTNQTLNELIKRRKRLTELEVQCYVVQTIGALKYLNSSRVIHRDLKLGNLFLADKMDLKLADFGLATKLEFDGEKKRTICGTPNYIAPEILEAKNGHSYEVDIWSLGVIIYTLLVGKPPFETPDVKTTYKKIRMNSYAFPEHIPLSEASKNMISRILVLDPTKRPTLDDILNHPFINHGGQIPKTLPLSTLACPPSASYLKQYMPKGNTIRISTQPQRLSETAVNFGPQTNGLERTGSTNIMMSTDKNFNPSNSKPLTAANLRGSTDIGTPTTSNNNQMFSSVSSNFQTVSSTKDLRPGTQKDNFRTLQNQKSLPSGQGFKSGTLMTSMPSSSNLNKNGSNKLPSGGLSAGKNEIWVRKWVDYSNKYGLGYLLSNNSTGVYFNDSSKIVLDPKGEVIEYIDKKSTDKQDIVSSYTITDYPKELQKKVTLLLHFKGYLENDGDKEAPSEPDDGSNKTLVYVKKWMKTKHAILFRLSNKIVQVNFSDRTEIILSSEHKTVTYVNKKGERSSYPLSTALDSTNTEMSKRLKYTKEILSHMLNNNNNNNTNNPSTNTNLASLN